MKVLIVTGGRYFWGPEVSTVLFDFAPDLLIHGGCRTGADAEAAAWARINSVPCLCWPAVWKKHREAAGPLRNRAMVDWAASLRTLPGVDV